MRTTLLLTLLLTLVPESQAGWITTTQKSRLAHLKPYDGTSDCIQAGPWEVFGPRWKHDQERDLSGRRNGNVCEIDMKEKIVACKNPQGTVSGTFWFESSEKCEKLRQSLLEREKYPAGVSSPLEDIECGPLNYGNLPIMEAAFAQKLHEEGAPEGKTYPEKITQLCAQVRCLSKRDKLSGPAFVKKVLASSPLPPQGKAILSDSIGSLGLLKCVADNKKARKK